MRFVTRLHGEKCIVDVTHYRPYRPAIGLSGPPEDAEEAIPAEFEYSVLTLDNRPWPELEALIGDVEDERLLEEYEAALLADKYGKDF